MTAALVVAGCILVVVLYGTWHWLTDLQNDVDKLELGEIGTLEWKIKPVSDGSYNFVAYIDHEYETFKTMEECRAWILKKLAEKRDHQIFWQDGGYTLGGTVKL